VTIICSKVDIIKLRT